MVLEAVMSLILKYTEAGIKLTGHLLIITELLTPLPSLEVDQNCRISRHRSTKPVDIFGLIINAEKTKMMVTGKRKETPLSINIQGENIEQVE